MAWDPTVPVTSADLLSAPVRGNFVALDTILVAPLTALANGQVLYKAAGPVLAGVPAGTNGYILTLVGGVPLWQPAPTSGFTNPMTTAGDLIYGGVAGVATRLAKVDGGLLLGGSPPVYSFAPVLDQSLFTAQAAPATPPSGKVTTYAKTDKRMYAKDDAGLETLLGGIATPALVSLPLEGARFPDGTANNLFPQPVERLSTGTVLGVVPKLAELVFQFDATVIEWLIWKFVSPADYVAGSAITLVTKWTMFSATTGNIRVQAAAGSVTDGTGDARALITNAANVSADQSVPSTLGVQKETRLTLTNTGFGPNQKSLIAVALYAGGASSAVGDRVLEAAWLEFAR